MTVSHQHPQPQAFLALLERNVSIKIVSSSWCPTMDIVVLVTADGQLQLFRLNWERLWSLETKQTGSSITSLEWSPLGKHVAYGDEDGNVVVLAAEDGSEVLRRRVFRGERAAVVGLSWTVRRVDPEGAGESIGIGIGIGIGGTVGSGTNRRRSLRLLDAAQERTQSHGFSACIGTDSLTHTHCVTPASHASHEVRSEWEKRLARRGLGAGAGEAGSSLSLLCAVNARGDGVVCGEGLLPLLSFRLFDGEPTSREETDPSGSAPAGAGVDRLACMRMARSTEAMYVGWKDASGLHVSRIDTSVIRREATMIRDINCMLSETLKDLRSVYEVMGNVRAHVEEVEAAREEHLDDMRGILGGTRDPEKDIYDFLVRGAYSLELKAFVGKEGPLKTTARRVDAAMSCMYHDIVFHLQPCLERIAFRLGDVRGYAMTPSGSRVLGLRPEAVGRAERRALDFVGISEHVRELVLKAASGYRNFYALMSMLQHREMGEQYPSLPRSAMQEVEELIATRFHTAELEAAVGSIIDIGAREDDQTARAKEQEQAKKTDHGGGHRGDDDEQLLEAVSESACDLRTSVPAGPPNESPRHGRQDARVGDEAAEDAAALEHLMGGLERWLDGGVSADHVQALEDAMRRDAEGHGSALDAFKSLLLDIIACPTKALSSHARCTHRWKILDRPCSFSMEIDQSDDLHVLSVSGSTFLDVRLDASREDAVADVRGGRLPDDERITSCTMYEKSDAILLTAVSDAGSRIAMVSDDATVRLESSGPLDEVAAGIGRVDLASCRSRSVPSMNVTAFAAGVERGVALALYAPVNAIAIYDLEEDDEEDGDEDGGGSDDENVAMA